MLLVFNQFKCHSILFESWIGSYQVLPLRVRVHLGAMEINGYSAFPNDPALLEHEHHIV